MILTLEELRLFVDTNEPDNALEARLQALEAGIHGYTGNNFKRVLANSGGQYPMDVKMGVVNILKWQLRNEAANNGDDSQKAVQSETISRHSVTYVTDTTESDIDMRFGVPKKYTAFLKPYMRARFGQGLIS